MRCAPRASNGPNQLGLCALQDPAAQAALPPQCYYNFVDPGAFALIGSAAFFGGVCEQAAPLLALPPPSTNARSRKQGGEQES